MSLLPEDLAAAGRAIIGRKLTPPSFMLPIRPASPSLPRLRQLHEATGHLAKTAPDILAKPEVARAIEEALMEAMVFCLAADHSGEGAQCPSPSRECVTPPRRCASALN